MILYTSVVLFHVGQCIKQLWCSSIVSCNITSIAHNHHTDIYSQTYHPFSRCSASNSILTLSQIVNSSHSWRPQATRQRQSCTPGLSCWSSRRTRRPSRPSMGPRGKSTSISKSVSFLFFTLQQPLSCPAFYPAHLIPSRNLTYTQRYFNRYGRVKSAMHWMAVKGAHWRTPYGSLDKSVRQLGLLEHPAVHVSYKDAEEYCHWATGTTDNDDLALGDSKSDSKNSKSKDKKKRDILRLPTEWEWEYAARGGLVNSTFPWGDEAPSWGETGKRANTMNIWHERDWDESSSSSSSSRGNKGNKFGKSNDWEKDGYNFTAPAKYVMLRDACKFYSLLLFTHVCDSFLCLIYRGTISLSIYPSPQIHTHTCSNKLHPSPTSTPPATIHQILCPQRSRDIPDMWECVGMGTWRHAREAYVTRRQFCGFLRRPVRESSLRGYISIWLICVLPSSSLLQSLDLALSSISFVLAHRISIILIKSNLFHE